MNFKDRLSTGGKLAGTFVKTPSSEIIEILALAGLDFICVDCEHSAFGRRETDWVLALARALGLPAMVRLSHADPHTLLQALDGGAAGLVVPHVRSAAQARDVARWARFGEGGRGFAGSTRSAGYTTRGIKVTLEEADRETLVIAQLEDPSALDEAEAIAATDGIDALFFGAADLAVGMGLVNSKAPEVREAFERVVSAASAAGKPVAAYCSRPEDLRALFDSGVDLAFAGSDQGWVLCGAQSLVAARVAAISHT